MSGKVDNKGLFVAFLGPDGTGKTTIAKSLIELYSNYKLSSRDCLYHFKPSLLPTLGDKLKFGKGIVKGGRPYVSSPRSKFACLLKMSYYLLDYIIGYLFLIRPKLKKGKIIIFDRYFIDLAIDPARARMSLSEKTIEFFNNFIPQPDIYFFLIGDPDIIATRKNELFGSEVHLLNRGYSIFAQKYGTCIEVTKGDLKTIINEITQVIKEKIESRSLLNEGYFS